MKLSASILFISLLPALYAQDHFEYWSKLQAEKRAGRHWLLGSDVQFRSQSNYILSSANPFQNQLAYSFRVWTNYTSKHFTVVASPFAFFRNFDIGKDTTSHYSDEWRMALGIQKSLNLDRVEIIGRVLFEHRRLSTYQQNFDRLRFQCRVRPLVIQGGQSNWQPYIQEEYFLRLNASPYLCDQNRAQLGIKYKSKKMDFSLAYQNTLQRGSVWILRHQIYTGLLLTL